MGVIRDQAGNPIHTSNPLPTRGYGVARTANPTAYSNGAVADLTITTSGAQVVKQFSIPELDWQFAVAAPITTAVDTAVKTAGAAGIRNYMTGLQFINTGTTATEITVKDNTTVIWRGFAPANMTAMVDIQFFTPLKGSAAVAMNFGVTTAAANVYVSAQGYVAP